VISFLEIEVTDSLVKFALLMPAVPMTDFFARHAPRAARRSAERPGP